MTVSMRGIADRLGLSEFTVRNIRAGRKPAHDAATQERVWTPVDALGQRTREQESEVEGRFLSPRSRPGI